MSAPDQGEPETPPALSFRNAFAEWDGVASALAFTGADTSPPVATIAITTFRRSELLVEAVRSARQQRSDRPYEIVVMDNDPDSRGPAALLEALPALRDENFRYVINDQNLGMFGNFNRSMQMARGEWMTILNDDDLLDESYLETMFEALDRNPGADGIVCRKRYLDQRRPEHATTVVLPHGATWRRIRRHLTGRVAGLRARKRAAVDRLLFFRHFGLQSTRRLRARQFFWGPIAGTPLGFLWRTQAGIDIGGFDPREFPASDVWFSARFATRYHLRQHRAVAATVRIAENESAKVSTTIASLRSVSQLQQALLADAEAPRGWRRLAPLVLARLRCSAERAFGVVVPDAELEQALGQPVVRDDRRKLARIRLLSGGWHPDPA